MADYLTTDTELTSVANAIRTKGGTSASLVYPAGFVSAIGAISTGTDVSDTTATASDVRTGKYFYTSAGVKTQGTIADQAAQTITPTTTDQTIASGKYLSGTQTIKGDANLIAGNIKKDVQIFGVTGNYEGSGSGGAKDGDVIFLDYDGTVVDAKTKAEINTMTSDSDLPEFPSHTGLTAQGWNWTVTQLKAQLTAMPDQKVYVGQMYITASGKTEIDVEMQEGRLDPTLSIVVNGNISVDWGDGTTPDTVTGTSLTSYKAVPHSYASAGHYTISISVVNGVFSFYGSSSYMLLRKNTTENQNKVYSNCVKQIRIGNGITSIGNYAFYNCFSLESITIPSSVTSIGTYAISACCSLTSITIPNGVTSIGTYAFYTCYALASVAIPSGVTSIGRSAFSYCYSIPSVTIPSGVTKIEIATFYGSASLTSITIPSGVTSIGDSAFYNCPTLASITIPSGVTSIGNSAFYNCYGMSEYHILPTAVPTGGTKMFNNIVSDCKIYVPSASLSAYQSETNWSTYASYMVGE